jgi:hypothetical protein
MDNKERGLYGKFIIERTDGKSAAGEKHDGCQYFVLDLTHDPLAYNAARVYAKNAMKAGYTELAHDLIVLINRLEPESAKEGNHQ